VRLQTDCLYVGSDAGLLPIAALAICHLFRLSAEFSAYPSQGGRMSEPESREESDARAAKIAAEAAQKALRELKARERNRAPTKTPASAALNAKPNH
jgi:hypothetical protein